jgi:hypothetical protein
MNPLITPIAHRAGGILLFDIDRCCVLVARSEA